MKGLWPRLPDVIAEQEYEKIVAGREILPLTRHPEQIYAPVGGRVPETAVRELLDRTTALATECGYPQAVGDATRIAFDRTSARLLRAQMDLSWAEAGNHGVWSFVALVVLPHLTIWRFGTGNVERWIASDLTRHTWARLWWQAVVFEDNWDLLDALSESDLNQLLERRSIGGDARLAQALGRAIVNQLASDVPRRYLIRDVSLRLRRLLAFVDVRGIDNDQVHEMCDRLANESVARYREQLLSGSRTSPP
jgi:hypothetical protein